MAVSQSACLKRHADISVCIQDTTVQVLWIRINPTFLNF